MADSPKQELGKLLERLADTDSELSLEGLQKLYSDEQLDTKAVVNNMRALFLDADKAFRQQKLIAAQEQYRNSVSGLSQRTFRLPRTSSKKRELLFAALRNNPEYGYGLTAQHRDFSEITDDEVDSYLKQLISLGVIAENDSDSND